MATYALYVLILFVINNYYEELNTPMDVFRKFFEVWGQFNWDSNIITMYSPIRVSTSMETQKSKYVN